MEVLLAFLLFGVIYAVCCLLAHYNSRESNNGVNMDGTTIEGLKERNAWLADEVTRFQHANEKQSEIITGLRRELDELLAKLECQKRLHKIIEDLEASLFDWADKYTDSSFKYNGAADKVMQLTIRCRQLSQMLEESATDNIGLQKWSRIMKKALTEISQGMDTGEGLARTAKDALKQLSE